MQQYFRRHFSQTRWNVETTKRESFSVITPVWNHRYLPVQFWHHKIWWRHQMETFSASPALCAGNSPVTSERPVTRSFDIFFILRQNKRLDKQSRRRWFKMPSRSLWRHCNACKDASWWILGIWGTGNCRRLLLLIIMITVIITVIMTTTASPWSITVTNSNNDATCYFDYHVFCRKHNWLYKRICDKHITVMCN